MTNSQQRKVQMRPDRRPQHPIPLRSPRLSRERDNPYSASQFKTMKYRPDVPARFGCIEDAPVHCQAFIAWYNTEHRHSGIGYRTPQAVHDGHAAAWRDVRQVALNAAFLATPRRFKGRRPRPHALPTAAWITPPPPENNALRSEFITTGAAKSLTRSVCRLLDLLKTKHVYRAQAGVRTAGSAHLKLCSFGAVSQHLRTPRS